MPWPPAVAAVGFLDVWGDGSPLGGRAPPDAPQPGSLSWEPEPRRVAESRLALTDGRGCAGLAGPRPRSSLLARPAMSDDRPDPDALLRRLEAAEAPTRGRLKVFFGASPGVGKTYAMLEAARGQEEGGPGRRHRLGRDPRPRGDGRPPRRPRAPAAARPLEYRGVSLQEFDIDARPRPEARPPAARRAGPHQRARARATPSAGRTWRSCGTRGSTSTPP